MSYLNVREPLGCSKLACLSQMSLCILIATFRLFTACDTATQATGSVKDRPRSGRPRKTTPREDRFILTSSRRNRRYLSRKLMRLLCNATGTRVSDQTVRYRLRSARLKACRPYVLIPLTLRHRQERRQWALAHRRWTRRQWNDVLFTDESRFNVSSAD